MQQLRKVGLDFLDSGAPVIETRVTIDAPVNVVFKYFQKAEAWVYAFDSILEVTWTTAEPHKVGTRRDILLKLPGQKPNTIEEEFFVWEDYKRFAFTFIQSDRRVFAAMVEDYQFFENDAGGTDIVWRLAYEGAGIYRLIFKFIVGQVTKDNQIAMQKFKTYIEERQG